MQCIYFYVKLNGLYKTFKQLYNRNNPFRNMMHSGFLSHMTASEVPLMSRRPSLVFPPHPTSVTTTTTTTTTLTQTYHYRAV